MLGQFMTKSNLVKCVTPLELISIETITVPMGTFAFKKWLPQHIPPTETVLLRTSKPVVSNR